MALATAAPPLVRGAAIWALGRLAPLATLLVVGYFGGSTGQVFMAAAIAGLTAYAAETGASVIGNRNPPKASDVKDNSAAAALNPVPTE